MHMHHAGAMDESIEEFEANHQQVLREDVFISARAILCVTII